jgi:nuclear-control-of-ATPase protein 2|tara:strand:- start:11130 stop:11447 length:318 start_codon:yes stop_codon:yes gene_type:complete
MMETTNFKDDEEAPNGSQSWLRDLWSQKNTTQTPLARTMSGSRTTLPVFFDRERGVGPTAFWLKEPHALAALNSEGVEEETREAELARAAQAALEVAQVRRPRKG